MARAHQFPRLILAVVCLPVFIGALDLTIVSAVLPEVIRSLTVEIQKLDVAGWAVTGYFVSYAISMTFMGRVSDISGRRVVYLVCLAIFFVGSWLVAASPGWPAAIAARIVHVFEGPGPDSPFAPLYALIFGRIIQAFGAGAMVPVSMALVADLFPPEKRALPLGIVGAVDTAGWVLGHLYGGIMVQFMTWPYLFWINLPIVAVMFAVTWWGLAGLPRTDVKGGIDWIGVTLLGAALILLNVGLGSPEISSEVTAPRQHQMYWVIGAAAVFVVFLLTQRRIRDPILDLRIFSNRNVSAANGVNLLVGFCIMVALVSVPLFINVAGAADDVKKAALVTGYLLCAFTVPMALAAVPGGWLSERIGYRWSVIAGLVVAVVGFLLMSAWKVEMARNAVEFFEQLGHGPSQADVQATGFMAIGLALAGIGIGLTIAPIGTAVINGVGEQERGMASSLVIILRLIGMSVSMSSMTAYGLRRTTMLGREMLKPEDALDLEKTARVALDAVTQITSEMALIALAVSVAAIALAALLRRGDVRQTVAVILCCVFVLDLPAAAQVTVARLDHNPLITVETSSSLGGNVTGPSVIRVPDWIEHPLGRYYMYFANHMGTFIRLAYADAIAGPWRIYEPGVLQVRDTAFFRPQPDPKETLEDFYTHVASPEVFVDANRKRVVMWFHGWWTNGEQWPSAPKEAAAWARQKGYGQFTQAAESSDGLQFEVHAPITKQSYLRVFQYGGYFYSLARLGQLARSKEPLASFESGPNPFRDGRYANRVRHVALLLRGNRLHVFFTAIGDAPERVMLSTIDLTPDWTTWRASDATLVLQPEAPYECADLAAEPSKPGDVEERVREIRDPFVFEEGGRTVLFYSICGEQGIAAATLTVP